MQTSLHSRSILALVWALPIIASGCLAPLFEDPSEPSPAPRMVPATFDLAAEGAHAYQVANLREGDRLNVTADTHRLALYGPRDQRLGLAENGTLEGVVPADGDYVVVTYDARAPVTASVVRTVVAGAPVARPGLLALPTHVERELLVDTDAPGSLGTGTQRTASVRFDQAPIHLWVQAVGSGTRLVVEVRSALGHVLTHDGRPLVAGLPGQLNEGPGPMSFGMTGQEFDLANLAGTTFNATIDTDLVGQAYLTGIHYQRLAQPLRFPEILSPDVPDLEGNAAAGGGSAPEGVSYATYQGSLRAGNAYAVSVPEGATGFVVIPSGEAPSHGYGEDPAERRGLLTLYGPDEFIVATLVVPGEGGLLSYPLRASGRYVVHALELRGVAHLGVLDGVPADISTHKLALTEEVLEVEVPPGIDQPVALKRTLAFDRPPVDVSVWLDAAATYSDLLVTVSREGRAELQCFADTVGFRSAPGACVGSTAYDPTPFGLDAGTQEVRIQATDLQGLLTVSFWFFQPAPASNVTATNG